jgi:hypothetical protein
VAPDLRLRPIERRILRLSDAGVDDAEIARRFRRSPEWVARVRRLAAYPRTGMHLQGDVLNALERRVLRWRAAGAEYEQISNRFRRSPEFARRVESLAHYKLRVPE